MLALKKKYIVDENEHKVAVQLDIKTYNQIEEVLENYALYNLMITDPDDTILNVSEAKAYYHTLDKTE